MKKVKTMFLMLFLILSGALCHVSGVAGTENEKGEDGISSSGGRFSTMADGISSSGGRFSTMAIAYANYHLALCFFAREAKKP